MLSPSAMVRINTVDIWAAVPGQDANGAPQFTYPSVTILRAECTVQAGEVEEIVEEDAVASVGAGGQQRVTRLLHYRIMFATPTLAKPRDKIIYIDSSNVVHTLFAHVERDEAGRAAAFVIRAVERL